MLNIDIWDFLPSKRGFPGLESSTKWISVKISHFRAECMSTIVDDHLQYASICQDLSYVRQFFSQPI